MYLFTILTICAWCYDLDERLRRLENPFARKQK